jgi:hypothetical protein
MAALATRIDRPRDVVEIEEPEQSDPAGEPIDIVELLKQRLAEKRVAKPPPKRRARRARA